MYSISDYGSMIADKVRTDAYARSLRQAVKAGSVVADIGTGTGIFAMLACRFGARKVYAIEPNDAIEVAREIARVNGYSDRIEFIQEVSTKVTLPERADVIVSDMRGVLPTFQKHLTSVFDARKRFLAPGGVLIPQQDTMWAAVIEAPELYGSYNEPWKDNDYGLDMEAARRVVINTWRKGKVKPEQSLVEPQPWATLDYNVLESPDVGGEITWSAERAGTAHGLCVWFDATLAEGVYVSNAPGKPETIYGSAFFPWLTPVPIAVGDVVSVSLRANSVGEDYVWRWDTRVTSRNRPGQVKAEFRQSTFFGVTLSPAQLRKQAAGHVPTLNGDGQIDRFILNLMDGGTSSGEIASQVLEKYPSRLRGWKDVLTRVGELSVKYSR